MRLEEFWHDSCEDQVSEFDTSLPQDLALLQVPSVCGEVLPSPETWAGWGNKEVCGSHETTTTP